MTTHTERRTLEQHIDGSGDAARLAADGCGGNHSMSEMTGSTLHWCRKCGLWTRLSNTTLPEGFTIQLDPHHSRTLPDGSTVVCEGPMEEMLEEILEGWSPPIDVRKVGFLKWEAEFGYAGTNWSVQARSASSARRKCGDLQAAVLPAFTRPVTP